MGHAVYGWVGVRVGGSGNRLFPGGGELPQSTQKQLIFTDYEWGVFLHFCLPCNFTVIGGSAMSSKLTM